MMFHFCPSTLIDFFMIIYTVLHWSQLNIFSKNYSCVELLNEIDYTSISYIKAPPHSKATTFCHQSLGDRQSGKRLKKRCQNHSKFQKRLLTLQKALNVKLSVTINDKLYALTETLKNNTG